MNNPEKRKRGRPFGSKVASGKKDGRPVFIPTEDQKFLVTMMSSTGVPHERLFLYLTFCSMSWNKELKSSMALNMFSQEWTAEEASINKPI